MGIKNPFENSKGLGFIFDIHSQLSNMDSKASSLLFFALFLAFFSAASAFNITTLLDRHPDFSSMNDYLSKTQLDKQINSRNTITVLAVDNSAGNAPAQSPSNNPVPEAPSPTGAGTPEESPAPVADTPAEADTPAGADSPAEANAPATADSPGSESAEAPAPEASTTASASSRTTVASGVVFGVVMGLVSSLVA